jgi:hypothetical protein
MMIAVAIIAVAMGAEAMRRRHDSFRRKADFHLAEEKTALRSVEDLRGDEQHARESLSDPWMAVDETTVSMDLRNLIKQRRLDVAAMKARVEWHVQMGRKYVYAASHPWLNIAADTPAPPIPEWVVERAMLERDFDKFFKQLFGGRARPAVSGHAP